MSGAVPVKVVDPIAHPTPTRHEPRQQWVLAVGYWVTVVVTLVIVARMLMGGLDGNVVGCLIIVLMLTLMALNIPVGISMIVSSAVGLYSLGGTRVMNSAVRELMYSSVASWSLSVVPLFVLLGIVLWRGGIAANAYEAARQWIGRVPGGLAVATNLAGAGLSASSGSTIGTSYALGRMGLPQMFKVGYDVPLATGSVAMAGTLGQIIPPSVLLVIFAGVAQTPVGPQLMSGLLPGIIMAVGFSALIVVRVLRNPSLAPALDLDDVTWRTRWRSLATLTPIGVIVVVVIGGMFTGVFTATESAAFGVLAALLTTWRPKEGRAFGVPRLLVMTLQCVKEAAPSAGAIMMIIFGSLVMTRALAISGLTDTMTDHLLSLNVGRVSFLLILMAFYIALGTFLEPLPMILLTVPVLQGPLEAMGVDMIWFGLFLVILAEVGIVSPPVGMLVFVVHRLAQKPEINLGKTVTMTQVFWGVIPPVLFTIVMLVVFVLWPDIVLWLPNATQT